MWKLVLDALGHPIIDLSRATPEQMRTLISLERDDRGRLKLKMRDPILALKLLAKNRGLLRDRVVSPNASGEGPARVYVMIDGELERACVRAE